MNPKFLLIPLFLCMSFLAKASPPEDSTEIFLKKYDALKDSVRKALKYETGVIKDEGGHVTLNIPEGFKYLNRKQSKYVLTELWGNPDDASEEIMGMIFPQSSDPFGDSSYAFVVSYSEIGYVKDEDAGKINYDELLKSLQDEEKEVNAERVKAGYDPMHFVGWAQKPFYDDKKKILHWAKEIRFGNEDDANTLNYEIRILGRKGMLSLNAVSTVNELPLVNKDISKVLGIASFTEGNSYFDFDPKIDKVAAWTIGGLVAGKLLAKAGFLAIALKFLAPLWKFIAIAFVSLGAWFRKRLGMKKKEEEEYTHAEVVSEHGTPELADSSVNENTDNNPSRS